MYETIRVERQGPAGIITISRPRVLNALSQQVVDELEKAIDELGADDGIRALIITGEGNRAFVAGADISELEAFETAQQGYEHSRRTHLLLQKMHRLDKPVIMAVNGYALGGGCELAMGGDIIIASDNARFGQPEVNLGLIPGFGGTQNLPRLVGRTRALEMIFTGNHITAEEAYRIGLVNTVVPSNALMETALNLVQTIASKAPLAVALSKRAVYEGLEAGPAAGSEAESAYFGLAIGTADRKEGTNAFTQKRKPLWQGR